MKFPFNVSASNNALAQASQLSISIETLMTNISRTQNFKLRFRERLETTVDGLVVPCSAKSDCVVIKNIWPVN